jgi:hypothetical protein
MFEMALILAEAALVQAKYEAERAKKWQAEFDSASPEMRTIMLKVKREMEKEATIERRHQEQIRAQKEVADAIRYAARPGRHFFDF